MTKKSAAKPTRAKKGSTGDFAKFWRREIWTCEQAERLWPTSSELLADPAGVLSSAQVQDLLRKMAHYDAAAYECLRWARWGEEDGLQVRCPNCNEQVWSHAAKRAKRRWRCVTRDMYETHQQRKGYKVGEHSRNGCGFQFSDTHGTPFEQMEVPLGVVFLALYFPAAQIVERLRALGESAKAGELSEVLTALKKKQYAELAASMRQMAKVFSGTLFLEYHPQLVSRAGKDLFEEKVGTNGEALLFRDALMQSWKRVIDTRYNAIRACVDRLERMDSVFAQRQEGDPLERDRVYRGLVAEIEQIASGSWFASHSRPVGS